MPGEFQTETIRAEGRSGSLIPKAKHQPQTWTLAPSVKVSVKGEFSKRVCKSACTKETTSRICNKGVNYTGMKTGIWGNFIKSVGCSLCQHLTPFICFKNFLFVESVCSTPDQSYSKCRVVGRFQMIQGFSASHQGLGSRTSKVTASSRQR